MIEKAKEFIQFMGEEKIKAEIAKMIKEFGQAPQVINSFSIDSKNKENKIKDITGSYEGWKRGNKKSSERKSEWTTTTENGCGNREYWLNPALAKAKEFAPRED